MGIQELVMSAGGALILLVALIYGVGRAGRVRASRMSDEATRRNFDKAS
jgi:hypothetical protein